MQQIETLRPAEVADSLRSRPCVPGYSGAIKINSESDIIGTPESCSCKYKRKGNFLTRALGRDSKKSDEEETKSGKWYLFGRKHRKVKPLQTLLSPRSGSDLPGSPWNALSCEDISPTDGGLGQTGLPRSVSDAPGIDLRNTTVEEDNLMARSNDKLSYMGRLRARFAGAFKKTKTSNVKGMPSQSSAGSDTVDIPSAMTLPGQNTAEDRPVLKRYFSSIHFWNPKAAEIGKEKAIKWDKRPIYKEKGSGKKPERIRSSISTDTLSLSDFHSSHQDRPKLKRILSSEHGPVAGPSGKPGPKSKQNKKKWFWGGWKYPKSVWDPSVGGKSSTN